MTAECSRAGCREEASWVVAWRNPRIHTEDRRKLWSACDEHVGYLRDYLAARDFPVEVSRIDATPDDSAPHAGASHTSAPHTSADALP